MKDANPSKTSSRPLLISLILVAALSIFLHLTAVTHGTFNLFEPELLGSAYDSLGKHLLHGSIEVDSDAIRWEPFVRDGKTFMYFGPFPAFLRIPLNFIAPENYGEWSRFSCFLASMVLIVALLFLTRRSLLSNPHLTPAVRNLIFCAFGLLVLWGSPILHLVTCAQLYHEPILWGLTFAFAGIYFLNEILHSDHFNKRYYLLFSLCAGGALLSRVTFGVPLYLILIVLTMDYLWKSRRTVIVTPLPQALLAILFAVSPAIFAGLFQLWYNFERFGSPLLFLDMTQYVHWYTMQHLHPSGSLFNLLYFPDTFWNYIIRPTGYFHAAPLFVQFADAETARTDLYNPGYLQPSLSLLIAVPVLLISFVLGMILMLKRMEAKIFLITLCFLFQALLILAFPYIVQRYILEFFPSLIFVSAFLLRNVKVPDRTILKSCSLALLLLLCVWSIAANSSVALGWMTTAPAIPEHVQNSIKEFLTLH
jgi:hypothetical protein